MMIKKTWLRTALCVVALSAMALVPIAAQAAGAPVKIKFWIEQTQDVAMQKMTEWFDLFNRSQDEVRVEIRSAGEGDEYLQSVRAALASGSDIDMWRLFGPSTMPPFADAGHFSTLLPTRPSTTGRTGSSATPCKATATRGS